MRRLPRFVSCLRSWLGLGSVVVAVSACAGSNKASGPPEEDDAQGAQDQRMAVDPARCDFKDRRAEQNDVNQDGRPDLVTTYQQGGGALACQQADLNFDGRLDGYFHYDEQGRLEREQFDLDFDGRIDEGRYYENGELVLDEQDINHDGVVDTWRRYEKGRLVRIETDRDGDGKADMFAHYVADNVDRIGYDVNGDGRVDQWDHDAARRARLAAQSRKSKEGTPESKPEAGGEEFVDEPAAEAPEGGQPVKPSPTETPKVGGKAPKADAPSKPDAGKGGDKKAPDPKTPAKGKTDAGKGPSKGEPDKPKTGSAGSPASDPAKPTGGSTAAPKPQRPGTQKPSGAPQP